tara:strand:+ start:8020 stop:8448 length:429 start_codon:yes stop_codon:yes gene_type:complete
MQEEGLSIDIKIGNIQKEWHWIKPELEELLTANPQLLYRPEDVYARCLYGESSLLLVDKGFIIVTITEDEVRDIKIFYVWIAKTLNKPTGLIELKNIWKSLEILGKQSGCSTIETSTPIKRVGRYLEKTGWTLKTLEYTKDI